MSEAIPRHRWVVKKAARVTLAFGASLTGALALRERLRLAPEVHVLTYHRFGDATRAPFRVSARAFEAHLRYLAEHELALSLASFEAFLRGELAPKPGAALVTVDDGSVSVHRVALPILRDYDVPAVVFAVAGAIGTGLGPSRSEPEPYLDWHELEEIAASGIDVQSHSMTHRSLTSLGPSRAAEEARASKELLEARLGREVSSFAYPYGTRADYDETTARILRDAGYRTAFTSRHGAVRPGADPSSLPRVKIEGGEPIALFPRVLAGGLDGWSHVDRWLPRLQARGAHGEAPAPRDDLELR